MSITSDLLKDTSQNSCVSGTWESECTRIFDLNQRNAKQACWFTEQNHVLEKELYELDLRVKA